MSAKFTSIVPWRDKLRKPQERKLVDMPSTLTRKHGPGKLLIPLPLDVDAAVRRIGAGRLATVGQIRARLAREHGGATACPLCTGIFLRIVAEAAEEARRAGAKTVPPYWRVVKEDGSLNPKFPGGVAAQAARLRREGHALETARGKKPPRVKDAERSLVRW